MAITVTAFLDGQLLYNSRYSDKERTIIDPTLKLELNKAGTFQFKIYPTHPLYNNFRRMKSYIRLQGLGEDLFYGRVLKITDDIDMGREIYCEGALSFLVDTVQGPNAVMTKADGNRYSADTLVDGVINADGTTEANSGYKCTGYISVEPGEQIEFKYGTNSAAMTAYRIAVYDAEKVIQPTLGRATASSDVYVVPNGVRFIRVTLAASYISSTPHIAPKSTRTVTYIDGDGQSTGDPFITTKTESTLPVEQKTSDTIRNHFAALINSHNAQVGAGDPRRLTVGNVTVSAGNTTAEWDSIGYRDTFSAIDNDLLNNYGGYLFIREEVDYQAQEAYNVIDYLEEPGVDASQEIRFGVNMLDLEKELSGEDLFTVLLAVGDDGLTDQIEKAEGVAKYGRIYHVENYSGVKTQAELHRLAQEYMDRNYKPEPTSFKVGAIDMQFASSNVERIKLGSKVTIVSLPHGVETKQTCLSIEYNFQNPENNTYEFGDPKESLSQKWNREAAETAAEVESAGYHAAAAMSAASALEEDVNLLGKNVYIIAEELMNLKAKTITIEAEGISVESDWIDFKTKCLTIQAGQYSISADNYYVHGSLILDGEVDSTISGVESLSSEAITCNDLWVGSVRLTTEGLGMRTSVNIGDDGALLSGYAEASSGFDIEFGGGDRLLTDAVASFGEPNVDPTTGEVTIPYTTLGGTQSNINFTIVEGSGGIVSGHMLVNLSPSAISGVTFDQVINPTTNIIGTETVDGETVHYVYVASVINIDGVAQFKRAKIKMDSSIAAFDDTTLQKHDISFIAPSAASGYTFAETTTPRVSMIGYENNVPYLYIQSEAKLSNSSTSSYRYEKFNMTKTVEQIISDHGETTVTFDTADLNYITKSASESYSPIATLLPSSGVVSTENGNRYLYLLSHVTLTDNSVSDICKRIDLDDIIEYYGGGSTTPTEVHVDDHQVSYMNPDSIGQYTFDPTIIRPSSGMIGVEGNNSYLYIRSNVTLTNGEADTLCKKVNLNDILAAQPTRSISSMQWGTGIVWNPNTRAYTIPVNFTYSDGASGSSSITVPFDIGGYNRVADDSAVGYYVVTMGDNSDRHNTPQGAYNSGYRYGLAQGSGASHITSHVSDILTVSSWDAAVSSDAEFTTKQASLSMRGGSTTQVSSNSYIDLDNGTWYVYVKDTATISGSASESDTNYLRINVSSLYSHAYSEGYDSAPTYTVEADASDIRIQNWKWCSMYHDTGDGTRLNQMANIIMNHVNDRGYVRFETYIDGDETDVRVYYIPIG